MTAPFSYNTTCKIALFIFLHLSAHFTIAQSLPLSISFLDEQLKRNQVRGNADLNTSFTVRPIYSNVNAAFGSKGTKTDSTRADSSVSAVHSNKAASFQPLPLMLHQQFNARNPFGWNDGSMVPARGYQLQFSGGFFAKAGSFSLQIMPEVVYAQNLEFDGFPASFNDTLWGSYYKVLNRIDNPEKFTANRFLKLIPGQSSIRFNRKKLSIGLSTENLWWGPGIRNSLLMSNTAPGFTHLTFNTTAPVLTNIGSFEWQLIGGILENSEVLPPETGRTFDGEPLYKPKSGDNRFINAMILTWQPKWTKGLHLGFSRSFYQYTSGIPRSLNGYFPVFGSFFKSNAQDEAKFGRDQLLSLFFRLTMPESKAEVYAEYGRNDHSQDLNDLVQEPEHARAYVIGTRKIFSFDTKKEIELFMEITHLQNPPTRTLRDLEGWYTHYQVRHGYTHKGQVLGAGIGPGGSSQCFALNWLQNANKLGFMFERIVRNNDFYYDAFEQSKNFGRHWVDLCFNVNKSWVKKQFIYSTNLSLINSVHYQWSSDQNRLNLQAAFSAVYFLRR